MIVHQAPGQTARPLIPTDLRHETEIKDPIIVAEEHREPAIAPLRDVARYVRDDDAGQPSQALFYVALDAPSISYSVPGIPIICNYLSIRNLKCNTPPSS